MEKFSREKIRKAAGDIPSECLVTFDLAASTNDLAKKLARDGAVHGTAVLAKCQTAGRGRLGRSFLSPEGGIYLSVILRTERKAETLMNLTALLAVCACDAVEDACGIRPKTKWVNDLVLENRKLAGILTEPSFRSDGTVDFIVCGIGMNVRKPRGGFDAEIRGKAISLDEVLSEQADINDLTGRLISAFARVFAQNPAQIMAQYRKDCATLGKTVRLLRFGGETLAFAETVDEDGALWVRTEQGTREKVFSGEAAVRGLYDYL